MFERFTEDARQVVVLAQEEARQLAHNYIGTEHLLLGLLREPDEIPAHALANFGLDYATARVVVTEKIGRGAEVTTGQIPFTPSAKKTLELALRASLGMGHDWIESGHILLGLVDAGESPGLAVLTDFGVSIESLRADVAAQLSSSERAARRSRAVIAQPLPTVGPTARFTVVPDSQVRRALMTAAGRALQDGREEFGVDDLLKAIDTAEPDAA